MKPSAGQFGDSALEQKWMILKIWSEPWPKPHYPTGQYLLFWSIILELVPAQPVRLLPPSPTSRWPRSTWTTCCARPCPIPSMGLGTECGRRATRRCSRSFTGSSWRSSRSRRAPCADTCWTHSDCAARKSTDCPQRRTQTSPFILNACSLHGDFLFYFILNHPFNASFETYNLFYWNTGAFQGQWINVSFI